MSYSQNEDTDFESASSTTVDTSQRTSDDDTLKDVDARLSDSKGEP